MEYPYHSLSHSKWEKFHIQFLSISVKWNQWRNLCPAKVKRKVYRQQEREEEKWDSLSCEKSTQRVELCAQRDTLQFCCWRLECRLEKVFLEFTSSARREKKNMSSVDSSWQLKIEEEFRASRINISNRRFDVKLMNQDILSGFCNFRVGTWHKMLHVSLILYQKVS